MMQKAFLRRDFMLQMSPTVHCLVSLRAGKREQSIERSFARSFDQLDTCWRTCLGAAQERGGAKKAIWGVAPRSIAEYTDILLRCVIL